MARADASRTAVRYVKELVWGTTPATPMTNLRFTGESLAHRKETVVSGEIRDDRQIPDVIEVGTGAGGDINAEMSFGEYDAFIESALQSTFTTVVITGGGVANNILFEGDPYNRIHVPSGSTDLPVGIYVKVGGATQSGNNSYFKITARALNTGGSDVYTVDGPLTEEDSSTATITASYLRNGTTPLSFTLEKEFKDVARFFSFTGMEAAHWTQDLRARAIATTTFSFIGKTGAQAAATIGTGTAIAMGTQEVMNASNNVGSIQENGVSLATALQALAFTVENNLREQSEIGTKNVTGLGSGRCNVTGTVTAYFQDAALYTKFLNHTATSLHFRLIDANGDRYFFTFPLVKFTTDAVDASGNDQDIMEELGWQALYDPITGITIQIDKFTASN